MTVFDVDTALLRVSVLSESTQVDVTVPAELPVTAVIAELVAMIAAREAVPPDPTGTCWRLAPVGGAALAPESTLPAAGVRDGALLVLSRSAALIESPVFDDIVDGIADLAGQRPGWSPSAAAVLGRAAAGLAAVIAAAIALVGAFGFGGDGGAPAVSRPLWTVVLGLFAGILWVAGLVVVRRGGRSGAATALSLSATAPAVVAGMCVVPGPLGAPAILLGAAVGGVLVLAGARLTGLAPAAHTALLTLAAAGAGVAAAGLVFSPSPMSCAAVAATAGVLLMGAAPRIAMAAARLPLPPVPSAGTQVTLDDTEPEPIAGVAAIGAISLPDVAEVEQRTRLTTAYLSGLVAGLTLVVTAGAVTVALLGSGVAATVFAVVVAAALALRGRTHADLPQAAMLVAGGALVAGAVAIGLAVGHGPVAGFAAAVALVAVTLLAGEVAPHHDFSPATRRAAEIGEYLLLAALLPLLCWLLDLYGTVRSAL